MDSEHAESEPVTEHGETYFPRAHAFVGWIVFAGWLMAVLGAFHFIQGTLALTDDDYLRVDQSGLLADLDPTAWGWIHLLGGLLIFSAGIGVFTGRVWARAIGVALAFSSAVGNFAYLGANPVLAVLLIAMDLMIIYALTVHGWYVRDPVLRP